MKMHEYLDNRITHLKNVEMEYFNMSVDKSIPRMVRDTYRRFSNESQARRRELEMLKREISNL